MRFSTTASGCVPITRSPSSVDVTTFWLTSDCSLPVPFSVVQILELHNEVLNVQKDQKQLAEALESIESSQVDLSKLLDSLEPDVTRMAQSVQTSLPADAEREK